MTPSSLTAPDLEDALVLVEDGLEHEALLTLVGQCEVDYDGRASSYLRFGRSVCKMRTGVLAMCNRTHTGGFDVGSIQDRNL